MPSFVSHHLIRRLHNKKTTYTERKIRQYVPQHYCYASGVYPTACITERYRIATRQEKYTMTHRRSFVHCRLVLLGAIVVAMATTAVNAFQMSMVASRAPFQAPSIAKSQPTFRVPAPPSTGGVTSGLISQLAVVALKLRLKDQNHVSCDVTANSSNLLLRGQVGPVTVKGRGWQSRLGLTCRAIEATVDNCSLDLSRILSSRKLVLTTPGKLSFS